MVPTRTIVHPCLDVVSVKGVHDIPRGVCNINQAKKALQINHICLTDFDHDYILKEIELRDKIETKRKYKC